MVVNAIIVINVSNAKFIKIIVKLALATKITKI